MSKVDKNACFEYLLMGFKKWYEEYCEQHSDKPHVEFLKEFTRLKSLKLLFLVASISKSSKGKDKDLLDIFNKFYAMQYGPVESDIYDAMVNATLTCFTFKNRTTNFDESAKGKLQLTGEMRKKLDASLECLKKTNYELIALSAMDLVEITHRWLTWKSAYSVALSMGRGSYIMDVDLIRNDKKHFS